MESPLSPLSYQPYLDQLIAFGSQEARKPDLLVAKAEYLRLTGEGAKVVRGEREGQAALPIKP